MSGTVGGGRRFRRALVAGLWLVQAPAHATDLLQIYRLAQVHDPVLAAAHAHWRAIEEEVPEARAGFLPRVSVQASNTNTNAASVFNDPVFGVSDVNRNVTGTTWNIQITQPIFQIQNVQTYREAGLDVEAAAARYAAAKQALILRVTGAYFKVLVATAGLRVARAERRAAGAQADQARHGYRAGVAAITDVAEAQAHLARAQARRIAAQTDWENARASLEAIIGQRVPDRLAGLPPHVVLPSPRPDAPGPWIARAQTQSPEVLAAAAHRDALAAAAERARGGYWPKIDVVASYGDSRSSGSLTTPDNYSTRMRSWAAGVQMQMALFSGGATYARVAGAQARAQEALDDWRTAVRTAARRARRAYLGVTSGRAQIAALESAVTASRQAVAGNRAGYGLGLRINLDVLTAERALYREERERIRTRYDTLLWGLRLQAAVGSLNKNTVRAVNSLLVLTPPAASLPAAEAPTAPPAPRLLGPPE